MLQNMRPPFWIERVLSRFEEPAQGEMSAGRHFTESTRLLSTALTAASPVVRTVAGPHPDKEELRVFTEADTGCGRQRRAGRRRDFRGDRLGLAAGLTVADQCAGSKHEVRWIRACERVVARARPSGRRARLPQARESVLAHVVLRL